MEMKTCPCVVCGKEVQVSKFMAPAKVRCDHHKTIRQETARQVAEANGEPFYLDEVVKQNSIELAEEARSQGLDIAFCPRDPSHDVAIKSVVSGGERGYVVTHQCTVCHVVICYSTQHSRELLPSGVKSLARASAGVEWRESRLGIYPERDLRGIILGEGDGREVGGTV